MALTIPTSNIIGAGTAYTTSSTGDALQVLQGITLATTSLTPAIALSHADTYVQIDGTVTSGGRTISAGQSGYSIGISATGLVTSFNPSSADTSILLSAGGSLISAGQIIALGTIGIAADLGDAKIVNSGLISGTTGVQLGVISGASSQLVNSGTIVANAVSDGSLDVYEGRGVLIESTDTVLRNLSGGVISSLIVGGSGILSSGRDGTQTGLRIFNDGEVSATRGVGIDLSGMGAGSTTLVRNTGTVSGEATAYSGGAGTDRLVNRGTLEGNVLMGDGADTLDARGGTLDGDWFGGAGNDLYLGMQDTVVYGDILGDAGNDTLNGGDLADTFFGGDDNDRINGFGGEDKLFGDAGNDILSGGVANDVLNGDAGNDILSGGIGDDALLGGDATDNLRGNDGADRLEGEAGGDVLAGGLGLDTFVFAATADSSASVAANRDQITDFLSGQDIIDLTGIDARSGTAGNQAFAFIGTAAFSGTAGELRYTAASGLVSADVNGDGVADFGFVLSTRPTSLVASDFLL